jgi:hypothetical protein
MSEMIFTAKERERLGVLVNNIGFYGTQLIQQTAADLTRKALANLAKVKEEDEALLQRLDELARELGDERPLRLIEDMTRMPGDAAQMLTLLRRCLLVCTFLGHCIAQPGSPETTGIRLETQKRIH